MAKKKTYKGKKNKTNISKSRAKAKGRASVARRGRIQRLSLVGNGSEQVDVDDNEQRINLGKETPVIDELMEFFMPQHKGPTIKFGRRYVHQMAFIKHSLQRNVETSQLPVSVKKALSKGIEQIGENNRINYRYNISKLIDILLSEQFVIIEGYVSINSKACYYIDDDGIKHLTKFGKKHNINNLYNDFKKSGLNTTVGIPSELSLIVVKYALMDDNEKKSFVEMLSLAEDCSGSVPRIKYNSSSKENLRRKISYYFEELIMIKDCFEDDNGEEDTTFAEDVVILSEKQGIVNGSQFERETNINRTIFGNFVSDKEYIPSERNICISVCVGLRLTLEESELLLRKAGICLTKTYPFDKYIVNKSLQPRFYDIQQLNDELIELYPNQPKMRIGSTSRGSYSKQR